VLLISTAIVRRGTDVLMVLQRGPEDREPHWALPGGVVEAGELVNEALVREVREETGLEVCDCGALAFVVHLQEPGRGQTIVYYFEVADWRGTTAPCADPDGFVLDARFFPLPEALAAVGVNPWLKTPRPIVSYLRGEAPRGALWLYRVPRDGDAVFVARTS
jgi:8-oxo-dGTP diphosphatase